MGTHPIFESNFDCLTVWENTVTRFLLEIYLVELGEMI